MRVQRRPVVLQPRLIFLTIRRRITFLRDNFFIGKFVVYDSTVKKTRHGKNLFGGGAVLATYFRNEKYTAGIRRG